MAFEMPGFLIRTDQGDTPAGIARKRAVADALVARSSAPKNVGEGLSAIGNALVYRSMTKKADAAEAAGNAGAANAFTEMVKTLGLNPAEYAIPAPAATPAPAASAPAPAAAAPAS